MIDAVSSRAPAQRVLLIDHAKNAIARIQLEPLLASRRSLRRRGWHLEHVSTSTVEEKLAAAENAARDCLEAVCVQFDWRSPVQDVVTATEKLRGILPVASRLVFLDYYDGTASHHLAVLPHVDAYIKKQLPQKLDDLAIAPQDGGTIARYFRQLYSQPQPPSGPDLLGLVAKHSWKMHLGWNLGANWFVRAMLHRRSWRGWFRSEIRPVLPLGAREIDVHCRVGLSDHGVEDWYRRHRRAVLGALEAQQPAHRVVIGASGADVGPPVPRRRYLRELQQARICVSPFGYGEICYRDFEAVAAGCLLLKPDMAHVRTEPNVYMPFETYVPFRWDLSDLADVLAQYLQDLNAAQAIATRARTAFIEYFRQRPWIGQFVSALEAQG